MKRSGESHYETLGIDHAATQAEVNAAFRRLAREHHPDRFAGQPEAIRADAEERFKRVSVAFEVLRDPTRREDYDRILSGAAPACSIEIHPGAVVARSAGGVFTINAQLLTIDGALGGQLDVRCDDPGVELTGLEVRRDPASETVALSVRGRVVDGGSRTMLLLYTAGAAAAAQMVELRVAAPALRSVSRSVSFNRFGGFWGWLPYALVVLGVALGVSGGAAYAVNARGYALGAMSFAVPLVVVGVLLLARNWAIMRFALEGWGRWIAIGLTIAGIRVAMIVARNAF
jgi:hypothetical protein